MRTLGVGKEVDRRGLLFVYDVESKRLRVEVGPRLEDVFPDGFVGYLMRENAASFFAGTDPELGLRTTLFMVHMRMRAAALGMSYDPTAVSFITDSVRLAADGGATADAGAGVTSPGFLGRRSSAEERAWFSAQPTVERAHTRYLEWLRGGHKQLDMELLLPAHPRRMADGHRRGGDELPGVPWRSVDIRRHQERRRFLDAFADMMDDYGYGMFRVRDGDNCPIPIHEKP